MAREGETISQLIDYGYKVEYPDGQVAEVKARFDEDGSSSSQFVGRKAGISGNISTLKTQTKVSDKYNASVGTSGPSLGGSLGFRVGSETGASAIVEPSLVKADGNIGPVYGSVGLNANTGVKLNHEGFKACILGFGINFGVGGKFTVDTPLGSVGAAMAQTHTNTHREENVQHAN